MGEREEKGEDLRGEKALGGKGGKGSQQGDREDKGKKSQRVGGKGGMDLNKERGANILEGKGARRQLQRDANKKAGL